jgi:hypothetical protein
VWREASRFAPPASWHGEEEEEEEEVSESLIAHW